MVLRLLRCQYALWISRKATVLSIFLNYTALGTLEPLWGQHLQGCEIHKSHFEKDKYYFW